MKSFGRPQSRGFSWAVALGIGAKVDSCAEVLDPRQFFSKVLHLPGLKSEDRHAGYKL
jgi:hypothetical protein